MPKISKKNILLSVFGCCDCNKFGDASIDHERDEYKFLLVGLCKILWYLNKDRAIVWHAN